MTQPTCSLWIDSDGHCCPDDTHLRDCIYAEPVPLKVKSGGTYINGYGRVIGPLEWDMVTGDLFFGPNSYSETGRCTTAVSRLNDLRTEYVKADQTEARQHEATGLRPDEVAAVLTPPQVDDLIKQHFDNMIQGAPPPVKPFPWRDFISLTGTHLLMFGIGAATVLLLLGV